MFIQKKIVLKGGSVVTPWHVLSWKGGWQEIPYVLSYFQVDEVDLDGDICRTNASRAMLVRARAPGGFLARDLRQQQSFLFWKVFFSTFFYFLKFIICKYKFLV